MKYFKILLPLLVVTLLTSCKKEDDTREIDDRIINDFLKKENLIAQKTSSGLYYIINVPGNFPKPSVNSSVTVVYKGYLTNLQVFDSTDYNKPISVPLTDVIEGWREGLQLFGEGGKGMLLIPSHLGYGSAILPGIPANSVLIFEIHLIKVD